VKKVIVLQFFYGLKHTCDWCTFFRCVAEDYLVKNPIKLGGPVEIVEIDETVFVKKITDGHLF
jgi:hypothetical protein